MITYINYIFKPKGEGGGLGGTCILEPCSKSNNYIPISDPPPHPIAKSNIKNVHLNYFSH